MRLIVEGKTAVDLVRQLFEGRDLSEQITSGEKLIRAIEEKRVTFDELAATADEVAQAFANYDLSKRLPPRPNDFVFTDLVLSQAAALIITIGQHLESIANRAKTKSEQRLVDELLVDQNMDEMCTAFSEAFKATPDNEMHSHVLMLAKNLKSCAAAESQVISGQSAKIDLPVYLIGQSFLALGGRLLTMARYSMPD